MPKFRQMYNKFIAEGDKVCVEFAKTSVFEIEQIYTTDHHHVIFDLITSIPITVVKSQDMEQMSALKTASTILLVLKMPATDNIPSKIPQKAIYLDGVQDPGNVGTIIRIADWFGIDTVIRSHDSADFFNPKTVQATMGSIVNVELYTISIEDIKSWNLPLIGTKMNGEPLRSINLPQQGVLVMGSEGRGISAGVDQHLTNTVAIPGDDHRVADSLNVSVAAGIISAYWTSK